MSLFTHFEKEKITIFNMQYLTNIEEPCFDYLLVLNHQCQNDNFLLPMLISKCRKIILADGGANHFILYRTNKVEAIVGDLDSILPSTLKHYEALKVKIIKIDSQEQNDYQKCLNYIQQTTRLSQSLVSICCIGAIGGRIDQTMSILSATQSFLNQNKNIEILIFGDGNMMYCLKSEHKNVLLIDDSIRQNQCGIIPFGSNKHIETKGFKWNVKENEQFGWASRISSSNKLVSKTIQIKAQSPVYFTISTQGLTFKPRINKYNYSTCKIIHRKSLLKGQQHLQQTDALWKRFKKSLPKFLCRL